MQNNLQIRIRELRKKQGLTQSELAEILRQKYNLKTERAMVSKWETGFQIPEIYTISCIADLFGVSIDYLNGKETNYADLLNYGLSPIKTKKIPMLGEIACGQPIYANEEYETFIEASSDIEADFCLTAKGDSMINAKIFDGDIVFIRQQPDVENGEIAAVIIDNDVTLKRVYKYNGRIELRPENPLHKVQDYEGEKLSEIRILGKAVAFQSYIR